MCFTSCFPISSLSEVFSPIARGAAHVAQAVHGSAAWMKDAATKLQILAGKIAAFVVESKSMLFFIGISVAVAVSDPVRFFGACGAGVATSLALGGIMKGHRVPLVSESMSEAAGAQAAIASVHMICRAIQSTSGTYVFPSNFREGAVSSMLSGFWAGFVVTDIVAAKFWKH
jgi:hypothetical protein